jgi:hypothetical protein
VAKPTTLTVTFTFLHEADPSYWALPVPVELRAEVVIDAAGDPEATPLDKAVWQDALGPEVVFGGVESPAWIGAKEAACDAACELLSQQATRETAAMQEAS